MGFTLTGSVSPKQFTRTTLVVSSVVQLFDFIITSGFGLFKI
jgi:hypothetical protein